MSKHVKPHQTANARIEALEARVAALEKKLSNQHSESSAALKSDPQPSSMISQPSDDALPE